MKKIVVGRSQVIHWWRIAVAGVVLVVLTFLFWPAGENERQVPVQRSVPSATRTVAPSDQLIPSRQFGTWKVFLTTEFSRPFCPPRGSFTRVERDDASIGTTTLIKRPDGRWDAPVYHPPGDEHLELGPSLCLRYKADRDTSITVTISRTPFS